MLLSFFYGSSRSNEVKGNPQADYNPASHIHLFFSGWGGTLIRTTISFLSSSVSEHSAQSVGRSSLKGAAGGLQQVILKSFHMYVDPLAQISTVYLAIQSPAL